jgi:signal transduction histidine kinase
MDRQPERARSALTAINEVSKQALVELRSVLGVLRDVEENAPRTPSPGLARLGKLVDSAAAAGLAVHVEQAERPVPLPAEVDLAAYRIVQEALTNAVRHSGGTQATVRVDDVDGGLMIEVDDNGTPRPAARSRGRLTDRADRSGHGIAGMTERAKVLGGALQAGRRPDGGYCVRAWLPAGRSEP